MMRATRGEMPDTATYCSRLWVWAPNGDGTDGDSFLGTVSLAHRPISGGGCSLDVYEVDEMPDSRPGCRTFRFTKLADQTGSLPYLCTVGPVSGCTCTAGAKNFRRSSCKHRDVATSLIVAGAITARQLQGA